MEHRLIPAEQVGVSYRWRVANAAARNAIFTGDPQDVGKFLLQDDAGDPSLWVLYAVSPMMWRPLTGPEGRSFEVGAVGPFSERSDFDNQDAGFSFLASDQGLLYFREGTTPGVWSEGVEFGKGDPGEGVPSGGVIGDLVNKTGSGDYETGWINPAALPISTATQTALDSKQNNLSIPSQAEIEAGTATTARSITAQRIRQAIIAAPVGTATQTALDDKASNASVALKADIASPALTGTPTAPTPAVGVSTTQIQTAAGALAQMQAFGLGINGNAPLWPQTNLADTPTASSGEYRATTSYTDLPPGWTSANLDWQWYSAAGGQLKATCNGPVGFRGQVAERAFQTTWGAWVVMATANDIAAQLSLSGGQMTGQIKYAPAVTIASSATPNLSTAGSNIVAISGTAAISNWTITDGQSVQVVFTGAGTLTHNATNNNLPSGANITRAAGDRATISRVGGTTYVTNYEKADGTPLVGGGAGTVTSVGIAPPSFLQVSNSPITTSGDITLSYSGVALPIANGGTGNNTGLAASATVLATARNLTIGSTAKSFNGSANVAWSLTEIGAAGRGAVTGSGLTMATSRLLGRNTAATGAIEEITLGTGLSMTGTTLNASATDSPIKAWVNFNGTGTVAIRTSFNVSSITDNGVGDYTINFTSALADADYIVTGMISPDTASVGAGTYFSGLRATSGVPTVKTSSGFRAYTLNGSASPVDCLHAGFIIVR